MPRPAPIMYSPDVETRRKDEGETIAGIEQAFDQILETTSTDYGHAVRAVHAKGHGILKGELEIRADLPPELAQGLFATPGCHPVWLRFSTNAGDILPDEIGLPRGLAIKVLEVEGERLDGAEGATQDFIMVNGPVFQAKTADKFLSNLKLLAKTTDKAEGSKVVLSHVLTAVNSALAAVGLPSPKLQSLGGAPNVDPLGETYFSVTPFRYGDHIAKFSLAPLSPELKALTGTIVDTYERPDGIRERLRADMAGIGNARWELRVQLCRDLERQPVENPTVEWKEDDAPFETVAILTAAAQDSWSDEQVAAVDEGMRFGIWTGLEAHRPLGDINRARRETYRRSADFRARFNGCPLHEPG